MRRLFGLALFAACAPAPVTLELPEVGTARALLVAVERGGELIEIAAFDVDATDPLGPQALLERGDSHAPLAGRAEWYLRESFNNHGQGGRFVTRNVIARRGLDMPRS